MTTLPRYLQRELDAGGDKPRVLIEYGKHRDAYWDATGDKVFAAALCVLQNHLAAAYIPSVETALAWQKLYAVLPELTPSQIEALPLGKVKNTAQAQFDQAVSIQGNYAELVVVAQQAAKAVDKQDGVLAWIVLQRRQGYEYEKIDLECLLDPNEASQ